IYTISTFLLGLTLFSISYLISAVVSDTKKVTLLSIVIFISAYMLNVVSGLTEKLINIKYFSLIYYFGPSENIVEWSIPIFLILSGICFFVGLKMFERRDISVR
ncbi:MAG: hypothetical protein WCK31_02545, partial [bacterium]